MAKQFVLGIVASVLSLGLVLGIKVSTGVSAGSESVRIVPHVPAQIPEKPEVYNLHPVTGSTYGVKMVTLRMETKLLATSLYTHKGQFDTPSVTRPNWMKLINTADIKGLSFAKSPSIGYPDKKTSRLIPKLVGTFENSRIFNAGNVAYPGSTWQITIWLKNGQAIGITPILRGELRTQPLPPNALGPGPGPFDYPPQHNQYALVYLRTPSTISNGANWMLDQHRRNQVIFFEDPSLSIQKMVKQLWR